MRVLILVVLAVGFVGSAHMLADNARASPPSSSGATPSRATTRPGTTRPPYINCYTCGSLGRACPLPFSASDRNVQVLQSNTGFCEKISPDNGGAGPFTRGPANP
ncbi:unnamed protein product, partial [Rotaria sordida]